LIVTRKVGEKVMIDDDIVIVIVEIQSGGRVRLGIQAPKDRLVLREELYRVYEKGGIDAAERATD